MERDRRIVGDFFRCHFGAEPVTCPRPIAERKLRVFQREETAVPESLGH